MERRTAGTGVGTVESDRMRKGATKAAETSVGERVVMSGTETVPRPGGPLAVVSYEEGTTINLGGFESQRITVRCEIPCRLPAMDETYEYAKGWVEDRLTEEASKVIAARDKGGK